MIAPVVTDAQISFPEDAAGLPFTGERYVPGISGQIQFEHYHRYLFALRYVAGKEVLDIACGEGYGAAAIAKVARSVLGIDNASDVVEHAARQYNTENLRFKLGDLLAIPADDQTFDVIVCFETLEHVADHGQALHELHRVLRPDGVLLISTPNVEAEDGAWHENNPFHAKELSESAFLRLLGNHFQHVAMLEQRFLHGSVIDSSSMEGTELLTLEAGGAVKRRDGDLGRFYLIAIASNGKMPPHTLSVLDGVREFEQLQKEFKFAVSRMHALEAELHSLRDMIADLQMQNRLRQVQTDFLRLKIAATSAIIK